MNTPYEQVYSIVEQIPSGKVASYSQISRLLGHTCSTRDVVRAMLCCPNHLPAHRVVMADGTISGGPSAGMYKAQLESEAIVFRKDGRVDMNTCGWQNGR